MATMGARARFAADRGAAVPARLALLAAALIACAVVVVLLLGGNGGYRYTFDFETGGQLVPDNQVLVAGQPVGTIDSINLTDNARAAVAVTMEEPLREGTTAMIRSTSLSGVANRYIALTPGPNDAAEIDPGATIKGADTTAPVDLDQIFNVFREPEREALRKFIQGNATAYADRGRLANRAYKFLNPALSTSTRLFEEINSDSVALERFLVAGSQAFGALADRRDDLGSLITNANATLEAIANRNRDLDRSLSGLPAALRQGNTTFVNLRATLDDLDPLVAAAKPATRDLAPFLRRLRKVAASSRPVFGNLADIAHRPGPANDLADTLADLPGVRKQGRTAVPATIDALDASQANVRLLRPYTPDLTAWLSKFAAATAYYDGNGHYARVQPAASNIFDYDNATNTLTPHYTRDVNQFPGSSGNVDFFDPGGALRCPGAGSAPAADGSNPFLDGGLLSGVCDPAQIPPGP